MAAMQTSALPFAPIDARAMAMGGTGVSSAEIASTIQYNPALLANSRRDDDFGIKLPQVGATFADEDGFIDEVEDFEEESELAPGTDKTNLDLLEDTLNIATNEIDGLPGIASAVEDIQNVLEQLGTSTDIDDLIDSNNSLTDKVNGLRGVVISSDDDPTTKPDSDLVLYSNQLAGDLDDLNNKALRVNLGGNIAAAIPSDSFSLALSISGQGAFSGKILVPQSDTDQLRNYTEATDAYLTNVVIVTNATSDLVGAEAELEKNPLDAENIQAAEDALDAFETATSNFESFNYGGTATPDVEDGSTVIFKNGTLVADDVQLDSTVHMIGAVITDVNLTASRIFNIKGHDVAIGITPKMQFVTIFDYEFEFDNEDENGKRIKFDEDSLTENTVDYSEFNMDIGAAYQFGNLNQWQTGLVIKNLLSKDFESANGATVSINPMARVGISHRTDWSKVAIDLDITENDPIAFESASQYLAIGAEFNAWRLFQLRAGYRANLAANDQDVITAGIGISPFAVHMDLGFMANTSDPEKEAGIALELGVEF